MFDQFICLLVEKRADAPFLRSGSEGMMERDESKADVSISGTRRWDDK